MTFAGGSITATTVSALLLHLLVLLCTNNYYSSHAFVVPQTTTKSATAAALHRVGRDTTTHSSSSTTTTSLHGARGLGDDVNENANDDEGRRAFFVHTASAAAVASSLGVMGVIKPDLALASGGATAGKYTTIPIAKRRYYGRVQEAVHEFLLMGPAVIAGDMTAQPIQDFFDVTKTVVVEARNQAINGQCTKKDRSCKGAEVRDSRYNDMKTSMYLLGNAFRINQTKAPDNLPTVIAARKFFKEMDAMEKLVVKKPKKNDTNAVKRYAAALDILDIYLDLVELPPIDSGHYEQDFSTKVGESSRIT